jgi:hypothetical protein
MHDKIRSAAVPTLIALLAGCGGGDLQDGSGSTPVTLQSTADALRELGNVAAAVKLAQTPLPGACSSGSDSIAGPAMQTRNFVYFSGVSATVTYETHNYSACVAGGTTYDGLLQDGANADGSYSYAVRGSSTGVLLLRGTTTSNGATLDVAESEVGTIETHVSGTQTEQRAGLESNTAQTPQGSNTASYKGALWLGVEGPTFDVLVDSSGNGGQGSETIAGGYNYNSNLCSGGSASVATPSALLLQASTDNSYTYPGGGTLSISSGSSTVTYSFSTSGATLSGSVSGTLSAAQVQQAFGSGSGC